MPTMTPDQVAALTAVREIVRARGSVRPVSFAGSFESAKRTRMDSRTGAPLASANAHRDRWSIDEQIRRCTDALRNDSLFRAIVRTLEDWSVGSAPDIIPATSDEAFNKAVSDWIDYADGTMRFDARRMRTLTELTSGVVTALACGGRVLLVRAAGGGLLAYEPERIGNPMGMPDRVNADGTSWVGGVNLDSFGRPVAYHVYDYDPSGNRLVTGKGTTVDAANAIYVVRPSLVELNQVTGEPALQSVLRRLGDVNDNIENTNWSYYIATLFGAIFASKDPKQLADGFFEAAANAARGVHDDSLPTASGGDGDDATLEMQRAAMLSAPEDTTPHTVNPPAPTQQIEPWTWAMLQMACADVGLPPALVFYRFIRSYSASRGEVAACWPRIERWQGVARRVIGAAYRHTLAAALRAGAVRGVTALPQDWFKHDVILPQMPVLDPGQDLKMISGAIDARLMDYQTAVRILTGQDSKVVHERLAVEMQRLRDLKIEPVSMPGARPAGEEMAKGPDGQSAKEDESGEGEKA